MVMPSLQFGENGLTAFFHMHEGFFPGQNVIDTLDNSFLSPIGMKVENDFVAFRNGVINSLEEAGCS